MRIGIRAPVDRVGEGVEPDVRSQEAWDGELLQSQGKDKQSRRADAGRHQREGDARQPPPEIRAEDGACFLQRRRSEEHTSELQSLMRISYAVFCLKKQNKK